MLYAALTCLIDKQRAAAAPQRSFFGVSWSYYASWPRVRGGKPYAVDLGPIDAFRVGPADNSLLPRPRRDIGHIRHDRCKIFG